MEKFINDEGRIFLPLKDMNTLTPDIHQQSEFEELIKAIEVRLNRDAIS